MTLGWRTALTEEVATPFMRSGTMHLFAISGLHIALLAGVCLALLRVARVRREWAGLITVPLLWFYTAATGSQPSAVRATLMMTVVIAGWALQRPGQLLNSLAAAAGMILVWEPRQLFQTSFQLSFGVVLALGLIVPPLTRWRDRLLQTDPLLPADLLPRWRRWLDPPVRWLTLSGIVSLAAWLGSLPLIAQHFHLVTPVNLLANVLVVPAGSLALMASVGTLLCGDWLPYLGGLFAHSAWFWMSLMAGLSRWAAELPLAYAYVAAPGWAIIGGWYAALAAVASGWALRPGRRLASAAAAGILVLGLGFSILRERSQTRLTVLPLGGGTVLWVDAPGRARDLLVDTGNARSAEQVVVPFLRAQGVNRLRHLALTHGDAQHVGGALLIRDEFRPAAVWTGPLSFRSPVYRTFVQELERTGSGRSTVARADVLAGWEVLHPLAQDRFSRADDGTLVLRGRLVGWRVLWLSDLGDAGQRVLLEREPDLRAEVVFAGVPAQGEALLPELLAAVRPQLVVVTDDDRPFSARVRPELRQRLEHTGVPVLFQSDTGPLTLRFSRRGWRVEDVEGRTLFRREEVGD